MNENYENYVDIHVEIHIRESHDLKIHIYTIASVLTPAIVLLA